MLVGLTYFDNTDLELSYTTDIDSTDFSEVEMALKSSKNRKAPGSDEIILELLKYAGLILITRLHIFINTCWITRSIPHTWRSVRVILLLKKGDENNCNNYRGTGVLNGRYKIYVKLINGRLKTTRVQKRKVYYR
jgi:hypothetical protein